MAIWSLAIDRVVWSLATDRDVWSLVTNRVVWCLAANSSYTSLFGETCFMGNILYKWWNLESFSNRKQEHGRRSGSLNLPSVSMSGRVGDLLGW